MAVPLQIYEARYNGFGGKVKPGESIEDAAIRELFEEAHIKTEPKYLKKTAELEFRFPDVPTEKGWDQIVHVYLVDRWNGEPTETDEMRPEWVDASRLPYDRMWEADTHRMPKAIEGKHVKARFIYGADQRLREKELTYPDDSQRLRP